MNYSKKATAAQKALAKYGQNVTHRVITTGSYDPATGTNGTSQSDTVRKGAIFDIGKGVTTIAGTLVKTGDKRLLVDTSATIAMQDHFIVGGVDYTIAGIGEINPAGVPVLYDLHLRVG